MCVGAVGVCWAVGLGLWACGGRRVSVRALEKVHLKICLVRLSRENMRGSNQLLKVQHLHDWGGTTKEQLRYRNRGK